MAILDLQMEGAGMSIREWLAEASVGLIRETEGFSGKRPLGNSGWWWEMIDAIEEAGLAPTPTEAQGLLIDEIRAVYSAGYAAEEGDGG